MVVAQAKLSATWHRKLLGAWWWLQKADRWLVSEHRKLSVVVVAHTQRERERERERIERWWSTQRELGE